MAKSLSSAVHTLAWYLARPPMYRELMRRIGRLSMGEKRQATTSGKVKEETTQWCRTVGVPAEEAMRELGLSSAVAKLSDVHPKEWAAALAAFEACHGTMGGPAHVDLLYHIVRETKPKNIIETGVAAGWSSMAILMGMEDGGTGGRLTSVDMPYPKRANEHLVGCVVPAAMRQRWTLVRRPDRDALPAILSGDPIDFAHYDSDKSYDGRMFAYPRIWDALQPGCLLMSDDVEDNFGFRNFAAKVGRKPVIVVKSAGGFAGLLRK